MEANMLHGGMLAYNLKRLGKLCLEQQRAMEKKSIKRKKNKAA